MLPKEGSDGRQEFEDATSKGYLKALPDKNIHRLVRVTALYLLVHKIALEMAAPKHPRSVTIVTNLGLSIEPQLAPGPRSGPFRVRIEARKRWNGDVGQEFPMPL
jgi:hypothetical protein